MSCFSPWNLLAYKLQILETKISSWNHSWYFLHIVIYRINEFSGNLVQKLRFCAFSFPTIVNNNMAAVWPSEVGAKWCRYEDGNNLTYPFFFVNINEVGLSIFINTCVWLYVVYGRVNRQINFTSSHSASVLFLDGSHWKFPSYWRLYTIWHHKSFVNVTFENSGRKKYEGGNKTQETGTH